MATIGFLGTGAIASAMVETLSGQDHRLIVSNRNSEVSGVLSETYADVSVADNSVVVSQAEIVILCLPANAARDVLPLLVFQSDQKVISVMAGMAMSELTALCGPALDICIMIPLPSLPSGLSPLVVFPHSDVVTNLFGDKANIQVMADENGLNAHFVATAMLLPIMTQLHVAAGWLGKHTGDSGAAESYLSSLLASYFALIKSEPNLTIASVMDGLSIKGGLNDTLNEALRTTGAMTSISETMDVLGHRLGLTKP